MADWPPNGKAAQAVLTGGEERFPGCATVGLLIGSRREASDRGGTGVSLVGVFAVQCSWGGVGAGTRRGGGRTGTFLRSAHLWREKENTESIISDTRKRSITK
jgi:hypothetical protein